MKVIIKKSTKSEKKYMAIFTDDKGNKVKTTHFGAAGFSHYPIHKNKARKQRYLNRHRTRENWSNYMSAGALSRWILWNKPTLKAAKEEYKKKFNLK